MTTPIRILIENTEKKDEKDLQMILENAEEQVDSSVLNIMYGQINALRKIDFSEIDNSKGDFNELSFHDELEKAHRFLSSSEVVKEKLLIIEKAKINIMRLKGTFEDGYRTGSDITILTYETMILAILDSTSVLISLAATDVVSSESSVSHHSLNILERFNSACENGKIESGLRKANEQTIINFRRENNQIVKEELFTSFLTGVIGIGIILAFIPLIRELIFYFYHIRMKISDYLDQLAMYIEINEVEVKNNPDFDAKKKADIIEKQNKWIERLKNISDKIRVHQVTAERKASIEIKKADKEITVDKVKDDISSDSSNDNGFDF